MRRKIVAGNWKMNNDQNESNILIHSVIEKTQKILLVTFMYHHHSHF